MTGNSRKLATDIGRQYGGGVLALLQAAPSPHLESVDEVDLTDSGIAGIVAKKAGDGIRRVLDLQEWRAFDGRWR